MTKEFKDSGIKLICSTCAWYKGIAIPKAEQPPDWTPRGFCYQRPPAVFPVPTQQKSSLALAQGTQQPGVDMLPLMMRPIVEADDNMCGSFSPNKATRGQLEELQKQRQTESSCSGCDKEGAKCEC